MEMVHVQDDVLFFLSSFMSIEAVLEATGSKQQDQKYT